MYACSAELSASAKKVRTTSMMGKAMAAFQAWSRDHIELQDNHRVTCSAVADAFSKMVKTRR